ncbi:UNVERIFIED_CONTAM: hypothetical protein GTU68_047457 [Idotea baltica]|nr:hypothetical protein [Idotea baltica]
MIVAFITPALVIIITLLQPSGVVGEQFLSYERVLVFLQGWGALVFLTILSLQMYHAAHRIHHGLHDLHIQINERFSVCFFYGGATLFSLFAAWLIY